MFIVTDLDSLIVKILVFTEDSLLQMTVYAQYHKSPLFGPVYEILVQIASAISG